MSGRGRGINTPAWMNQPGGGGGGLGGGGGGNGGSGPAPDNFGRRPLPPQDYHRGPPQQDYHRGGPPQQDYHRGPPNRGPPPPQGRYNDRPRYDDRGPPPPRGGGYRGRGRGPPPPRRRRLNNGSITFRSLEEEQDWVQERRRKRLARPSKFDKPPTAEQAAAEAAATALGNPAASDFSGVSASNIAALPQQTRHARRLYIGNLPPYATEDEIHSFFRHSIDQALVGPPLAEDPILSVYINHERHFCFLEFKTVEMATACMAMDGLDLNGRGKVKVKRPNDYNPVQAPKVHPSAMPAIDVSRLGIINGTVDDGANKIFIGGLHYHLQDQQVVELLQAFGKVKAFHLVKQSNEIDRSKGYCFVEYSDSAVTPVAVAGLNGMDIGGGKSLTARLAGEPPSGSALYTQTPQAMEAAFPVPGGATGAPMLNRNIVSGYDIEELVDAAMDKCPMPTAPQYLDGFGMPMTRLAAIMPVVATLPPPPPPAAAAAAVGMPPAKTRILVLHNMVSDEDLTTAEDHQALVDEVREECTKYGNLRDIRVPRSAENGAAASAIRKIFLEYASVADAEKAEHELAGRQFGESVVETSYFSEADFAASRLF